MSELTVAYRYAKSLIDLAQEQNSLEAIKDDMTFFVQTLKSNSQLAAVLRNPIIAHNKKVNILDGLFASKVNKATVSFFNIMVNKGRGGILYPTAQEFINLYNQKKNIVTAKVVSATPLSDANKQQIMAEIKASTGGEVILKESVDANLIGGFVLTIGDRQIDTSVARDLQKLKKEFTEKVIL